MMLKRLLQRLEEFEDDLIAPVVGLLILIAVTYAILLLPTPGVMVSQ